MRVTVQDAAELLNMSEKTIYRWIKQGIVPVYKVSEQYRFNRAELLAWATSRRLNVSEEIFHEPSRPAAPLPTLVEALQAGGIVYRMEGQDKEDVLRHLADNVRLPEEVDRRYLYRLLIARETLGSTGVGGGVAVPQLIYPNSLEVSRAVITLAFLERPVDFQALDGLPVRCLLALISPTVRGYFHLLTRLQFALRDPECVRALTESGSREQVMSPFVRFEEQLRQSAAARESEAVS